MSSAEEKLYEFADKVQHEGQEAKAFVSGGISKVKTKMSAKTYGPPRRVPVTPSKVINDMLETRCNKTFDNPAKFCVASYICLVFFAITKLYEMIYHDKSKASHTMWMVACGVVSLGIVLQSYIFYQIIIGCSFLVHNLLFYGFILLALLGLGLGVSGMVFFDKEPGGPAARISSTFSTYSRTGPSYDSGKVE